MSDEILVSRNDAGVVEILLNRPDRMNALGVAMTDQLRVEIEKAVNANVLVIRATGRAFCSGADLKERRGMTTEATWAHNRAINAACNALEALPIPTIVAVNGIAMGGGCELALSADIRLIAASAVIGLTEPRIGAIPGSGGTQRLPRVVGVPHALEMMYTADPVSAQRAYEIGLVSRVFADEVFEEEVARYAAHIASRAPQAIELLKRTVREGMQGDIVHGLEVERQSLFKVFGSSDYAEGLAAFGEKRPPNFRQRGSSAD
jgi:enoyl-CoA hydratase/carnithine racemase